MKKRVFMVHGWAGYPEEGWRPWLKRELEKRGWEVFIPAMPDSQNPKQDAWVTFLNKSIGKPDTNTYLLGHSLGAITILRYLENLKENESISGCIFFAGFSNDLDYEGYKGELSNFFKTPVRWNKIKSHCDKFIVVQSKDDKWVNPKNADILEEKLNAKKILQNGMKHYSGDDGITQLPIALELILKISK